MSKLVGGKKPLSAKPQPASFSEPDFFMNRTAVSAELAEELTKKGLDYRWIDYKKYVSEGNMHSRGWRIYKREGEAKGTDAFLLGSNPDGIIRRGTMVLATRPIEQSERHRAYITEKNNRYKRFNDAKTDELRQKARELGSSVDTDYDEDDSD